MNSGVLAFDAAGKIKAISIADFPAPHFNGGTPTGDIGSLVVAGYASGYTAAARIGGLPYSALGGLVTDALGAIVARAGGIPLTANGVAVEDAAPVTWVAGIPISANGKVCLAAAAPPVDLSPFSTGFSVGFQ
jgi:hypothetical protein